MLCHICLYIFYFNAFLRLRCFQKAELRKALRQYQQVRQGASPPAPLSIMKLVYVYCMIRIKCTIQ